MTRYLLYRFSLILIVILLAGCSTEKNTFVTRSYHNLTAHYNVYYNGKVSLQEGVDRINSSVDDDYANILPIFKSSNPSTSTTAKGSMEYAIQKASKLIQSHSITKKPKRRKRRTKSYLKLAKKDEYNNWIDDAYILMGQAYFYQHIYTSALENFSYTVRKFGEEKSKYEAYIWMIRCYTEMERFVEAQEIIQLLQGDPEFPRGLEEDLAIVTADYYAKRLNFKEGIPYLSIAAKKAHKKTKKLRYKYILAQWYNEVGNSEKASQIFREVARMNPPYEMAFNARISAAGTFTGKGDSEKLKKALRKMLKDSKNKEYLDQIYFALGNIFMKEGNRNQAIDYYIQSAASSIDNMYQRAHSCLTLAQLYFEDLEYKNSQSYYDSAMIVIDENYPDYESISERYASLSRLVENLYTVEREDSLQRIAAMDEDERNRLIDQWVQEAAEKEQLAQQQEMDQMMNSSYYQGNQNRFNLNQQQGAGWYFYNPSMIAYGKVEFERIWGRRKLEDGWRLSDKTTIAEDEEYLLEEDSLVVEKKVVKVTDPKNREYYIQDLPVNDSLLALSNERIRDALFYAGRIFKTEFQDYPRSIESYLDLNKRYPDNMYKLSSYFELWGLYKEMNDIDQSNLYKSRIIELYPESKYARYLLNPNYFVELKARQDTVNNMYQKAFYKFKAGDYSEAGAIAREIHHLSPDSALVPKIEFFTAIDEGTKSDWNTFGNILKEYVSKYPKAETIPLVEQILKLIDDSTLVDYQQLVESGYLNDQIQNTELLAESDPMNDEFGGKFSYDEELLHYFVIAFPKEANVDINRLKFDIANYNIDHYTKTDFEIETENLNTGTTMVVVRSLIDKEESLIYFRSIIRSREVFHSLEGVKYANFVASSTNYREITADKEYNEYLKFFIKNYSRFIGNDFPKDELPDPEVLIAEAQAKEEEEFEEKGTFVLVKSQTGGTDDYKGIYKSENEGKQNFVIAVNAPGFSMSSLQSAFSGYNDSKYLASKLNLTLKQMEEYQLLIVRPFEDKISALRYFTDVVSNRRLFRSLDTLSYRNFTITDSNLEKLLETKELDEYLDFFKIRYIGGSVEEASTVEQEFVAQSQEEYLGPYKQQTEGNQVFVLILPVDQVVESSLLQSVEQFNDQHYASFGLKVNHQMLDDFRLLVSVDNLKDKETGMEYLRSIATDEDVYGRLQDANYRNFIISSDNFQIFMQDKNILTYMEFYKRFYLNK